MRYSITGLRPETVELIGGSNIKSLRTTGVIFADLDEYQSEALSTMGADVQVVERVYKMPEKSTELQALSIRTSVHAENSIISPIKSSTDDMYYPEQLIKTANIDILKRFTGKNVNIAVIDTGIRETHEKIANKVVFSKNYTQDEMIDGYDHGTGVASILLSVVPDARLLNMKVMASDGDGSTEEIIEAIEDCINMRENNIHSAPAIINISAGTADNGNPNDALRLACRIAIENGVWISAAVGNSGPDDNTVLSPACEKYVFATGSIKPDGKTLSNFSSRGPTEENIIKPDCVFYGENIIVASSRSDSSYNCKSGTSFSAPFATGIAAMYMEAVSEYKKDEVEIEQVDDENLKYTLPISIEDLLNGELGAMCIKPASTDASNQSLIKDNDFGYGILNGKLIAQSLVSNDIIPSEAITSLSGLDISSISGVMIMMPIIGIMGKIMGSVDHSRNKESEKASKKGTKKS
jgi:serine protease AprX